MNSRTAPALLAVVIAAMVAIPLSGFGQGQMNIVQGILPLNYTQGNVNDFVYAMENGLASYGSWNSIPNASLVQISNVFNWSDGSGNAMFYGLSYTNSVPFTLASIGLSLSDRFGTLSNTFGGLGASFTLEGVGINGSTIYTSDNSTTPVTAVYVLGAGYTVDNGNSTLQQGTAAWAAVPPIYETVTYYAGNMSQSALTIYATPEPSTIAF